MKLPHRDAIAFEWSMTLMRRAFRDLAVSFAAVDAEAADKAIGRTELMVAAEFTAFREKPPKGITAGQVSAMALEVIPPFREMTQEARHLVQQAGKPKH